MRRLAAAGLLVAVSIAAHACPPSEWPRAQLEALKASQWQLADAERRTRLAFDLLPCLASPDPQLRDQLAFEALQTWLRTGALTSATSRELGVRLQDMLSAPDPDGVARPFAMLALAEVVRDDRLRGVWTSAERDATLTRVAEQLRAVTDYRGFEPGIGWRHSVAHASDALMQFALNPALTREQLDRILAAVASQVMPAGHAYVHGESERLARPVLFVARRGLHSTEEWRQWFTQLTKAAVPPGEPASLASLARVHDVKGFLMPLYIAAQEGGPPELRERVLPGLVSALRALP
ncbi:DUF2785 domain-containing protein [Caldimonas sp. KR1-144]|uniref:DUF2785 domain-containing protein n=1 Tax=Caldimonas sp. KR1-144 TaxID=3400911 RepID=UPI003C01D6DD